LAEEVLGGGRRLGELLSCGRKKKTFSTSFHKSPFPIYDAIIKNHNSSGQYYKKLKCWCT